MSRGWGFCRFCEVKSANFKILRLFWVTMSLGKKTFFFANLKGHIGT